MSRRLLPTLTLLLIAEAGALAAYGVTGTEPIRLDLRINPEADGDADADPAPISLGQPHPSYPAAATVAANLVKGALYRLASPRLGRGAAEIELVTDGPVGAFGLPLGAGEVAATLSLPGRQTAQQKLTFAAHLLDGTLRESLRIADPQALVAQAAQAKAALAAADAAATKAARPAPPAKESKPTKPADSKPPAGDAEGDGDDAGGDDVDGDDAPLNPP